MGKYDGVISDYKDNENQVKFNLNDFHWSNDNMININKNLKFILHGSQYSDKFTIKNDVLDIDKDKIEINPKSIIQIDQATGAPNTIISVNNNDKLMLNLTSDFMTLNNSLYCNLGAGLTRDDQNRITISLAKCNLKFVNNQLCFDTSALIDNFNCIKLDDKNRLKLNYNANDFIKDSTSKLWLKIYDKHLKRTQNGVEINIDNNTIFFDTNEGKLVSSIDKYVVPQYAQNGDIYLDTNKKMKLNINNYVDDNVGSKVIMNTHNKIDLDIVDQSAGEIYFKKPNELAIRPSPYFTRDSSGHLIPVVNENHGLNLNNHKLNLDVSAPIEFVNKKLTIGYDAYFKLNNNKLDIDINKLTTDVVIPKASEGIKLNSDRTLSIDKTVIISMLNVGSLSGLKIVGNQLIVDESIMGSNLIRLNSNSPIKRRANNFYEIEYDRVSIDSDFTSGALLVKPTYVPSVVTTDYIKNKVVNESYFKDMLKFQGPCILKRCALCWWNLDIEADVDKTINTTDVTINKFQNQKHRFNDFYYFTTENNPTYYYKHYSTAIFSTIISHNYIYFNNTNQRIKYTDSFVKKDNLITLSFNFIIEPEKKNIDINSTLFQSETNNYIKLLYDNQGIIYKFGDMYKADSKRTYIEEVVIPTPTTLLNRKNVITIYISGFNDIYPEKIIVYVNSNKIYDSTISISPSLVDSFNAQQYHIFNLCNNNDNSQSFNGKFYDYSMLQNITEQEAINLHEYYKYIHNI